MRPPLLLDMNLSPAWARRLAVAFITIIVLVTTTGCWLEADDAGGSDEDRSELRDYAAAMRLWWLEVNGGELPGPFSLRIDHARVLDAVRAYDSDPLPFAEPPRSIRVLHKLLVNTVRALARAEAHTEAEGYYAGLAAAFCDPRDAFSEAVFEDYQSTLLEITAEEFKESLLRIIWWQTAPLQDWHWYGESCHDGDRWAGNRRSEGIPPDLQRDFNWGCSNYDQLSGFGVRSGALISACGNAAAWARAVNSTALAWSAELIRLCGGQEVSWPVPADALATCE